MIALKHLTVAAISAVALGGSALLGAGTAGAVVSAEDEFLNAVDEIGIVYDTPADAIHDAQLVCSRLDGGEDPDVILDSYLEVSPELTERDGKDFIVAAVTAYCPQHLG